MNWLVYHIVSGQAFFTGITLVIIAALASTRPRSIFHHIVVLAFLIGVIAIIVSSTAIPYAIYAVATGVTLVWIMSSIKTKWLRWTPYATVAVWLLAALLEIPYYITTSLQTTADRSVTIIGDSVSAGIGGDVKFETWPTIISREHQLQVQDLSRAAETSETALSRVKSQQITGSVVIIELGGNDILGSTPSQQFARNLRALLDHIATHDRQIVMFELPLPPFSHEYGRIQRTLAAEHNVILVPKRIFLSIIANSESTLDTIHLSPSGHQSMADCVWKLIKSAFESGESK